MHLNCSWVAQPDHYKRKKKRKKKKKRKQTPTPDSGSTHKYDRHEQFYALTAVSIHGQYGHEQFYPLTAEYTHGKRQTQTIRSMGKIDMNNSIHRLRCIHIKTDTNNSICCPTIPSFLVLFFGLFLWTFYFFFFHCNISEVVTCKDGQNNGNRKYYSYTLTNSGYLWCYRLTEWFIDWFRNF